MIPVVKHILLGRLNFSAEFDAYFSRASGIFEVKPKQ